MAKAPDIPQDLEIADELIAERRSGAPGDLPPDMPRWMASVITIIDTGNMWIGKVTCILLLPIMFAMVYEIVARKLFVAPTMWAYDISRFFYGALFILGAGYGLMRGVHIRADFLYRTWAERTQTLVDLTLYLLLFFPGMLFFLLSSVDFAWEAWDRGERGNDTAWMPIVGPIKSALPIGIVFLLVQGVSEVLRCLYVLPQHWRKIAYPLIGFYAYVLLVNALSGAIPAFEYLPLSNIPETLQTLFGDGQIGPNLSKQAIGAIMIAVMLFAIFIGFPISFTLIFLGMVFGYWGFGKLVFYLMTFKFYETMVEQTLAAVPLFVFMGIMMEQAGLMERLFEAVQKILSKVRGALYLAVLFVSTIFAAATGIVGASVTILGIMSAKTMNRSGYDVRLAAGTITAGGTLGILIPPSIMLVVMGPVLEVPVTDLFAAAIIPGIMLATMYAAYALIRCAINPSLGPALTEEQRGEYSMGHVWHEFFMGLVPPAALVGFALGSILFGWATPTEGAGSGAIGAVLLSLAYGKLNWRSAQDAMIKTLEISVLILFLVAASNFFGAVFANLGTPTMLTNMLLELDLPPMVILLIVMALIFLLGWPLEWVPIVLIIVPILIPLLVKLDINLTWFGILVAVNLQTAWLSPPVALSAYFLKGVVPEWDLKDIYFGMMQFMVIQLIGLALILIFPQIALWLPAYIYGN